MDYMCTKFSVDTLSRVFLIYNADKHIHTKSQTPPITLPTHRLPCTGVHGWLKWKRTSTYCQCELCVKFEMHCWNHDFYSAILFNVTDEITKAK